MKTRNILLGAAAAISLAAPGSAAAAIDGVNGMAGLNGVFGF